MKIPVREREIVERVYTCDINLKQFKEWLGEEEPSENMLQSYIYEILEESPYRENLLETDITIEADLSKILI